jgi:putative tricarboxylic transport membrane protein
MKSRTDLVYGLLLFLIGIGSIIEALRLHIGSLVQPEPGFFPFLAGISLAVFSFIIFLKGWLGTSQNKVKIDEMRRPALLIAVLIALVAALDFVGYVIGSLVASVLILCIMNVKSWRVLVVTSCCLSIGTYVLFDKILGINLPVGILAYWGL